LVDANADESRAIDVAVGKCDIFTVIDVKTIGETSCQFRIMVYGQSMDVNV
jgi:hypothetical protein